MDELMADWIIFLEHVSGRATETFGGWVTEKLAQWADTLVLIIFSSIANFTTTFYEQMRHNLAYGGGGK
jgi:hypothetical protein